jgi:hypothetical protein
MGTKPPDIRVQRPARREPEIDPDMVRPRAALPDAFEQNPLSQVSERLTLQACEGLDDAGRVREAMRIVIAEGIPISDAARRCHVAPSCLAGWREKYLTLLNEEPSVAVRPLIEEGCMFRDADLVRIPAAAREHFAENWERLMEITRATPSTFRQHPVILFLENSSLTGWLYTEGRLDRGVFAGAAVVLAVLVLTATFLSAGHFYRQDEPRPEKIENLNTSILKAAEVAKQFFRAEGLEEKMKYVRMTDAVRGQMEEYYRDRPASGIRDATLATAMPMTEKYALEFEIPSLQRKHLCVVVERDGRMLVDWETSSLYQEAHLEEIRRKRPRAPVRVAARVVEDTYYNYGFSGNKYTCFRLSYPGLHLDLFAYAAKDSLEEMTLKALLEPVTAAERQITAVLEVKYPEGDVPANQVEIVRILNEEWVAP